jgi:hypothetical protein
MYTSACSAGESAPLSRVHRAATHALPLPTGLDQEAPAATRDQYERHYHHVRDVCAHVCMCMCGMCHSTYLYILSLPIYTYMHTRVILYTGTSRSSARCLSSTLAALFWLRSLTTLASTSAAGQVPCVCTCCTSFLSPSFLVSRLSLHIHIVNFSFSCMHTPKDTVRCIMQSLTGERAGAHQELKLELEQQMHEDEDGLQGCVCVWSNASCVCVCVCVYGSTYHSCIHGYHAIGQGCLFGAAWGCE